MAGKKKCATPGSDSPMESGDGSSSIAPQSTGGGGGLSSPVAVFPPLVNACEFAHQPKPPRSQSIFHRKARERLRRAAYAAEYRCTTPGETLFITGTAPYNNLRSASVIGEYSGWIIKRLKNWLRQFDLPGRDFYVWERHKNGSLHLHYACFCPHAQTQEAIKKGFHPYWVQMLQALTAKTGINLFIGKNGMDWSTKTEFVRTQVQEVRKSVGRYLAKYLSKQHGLKTVQFSRLAVSPRRWWGCSQSLKKEVNDLTTQKRIQNLDWMQSRNVYERLKEKIRVVIDHGNYYESRSEQCDAESFTLYYDGKLEVYSQLIRQLMGQSKMKTPSEVTYQSELTKWKVTNSESCLQLMKTLVSNRAGNAASKIALEVLTRLNELMLAPDMPHPDLMRRLCLIYDESINRLEIARRRVPYLHKARADQDVFAVQKAVFAAWDGISAAHWQYKRTTVKND